MVGDRVYVRDLLRRGGEPIACERLLLHAATLGFCHPLTGENIALESPLGADFESALAALRQARSRAPRRGQSKARFLRGRGKS